MRETTYNTIRALFSFILAATPLEASRDILITRVWGEVLHILSKLKKQMDFFSLRGGGHFF